MVLLPSEIESSEHSVRQMGFFSLARTLPAVLASGSDSDRGRIGAAAAGGRILVRHKLITSRQWPPDPTGVPQELYNFVLLFLLYLSKS